MAQTKRTTTRSTDASATSSKPATYVATHNHRNPHTGVKLVRGEVYELTDAEAETVAPFIRKAT